MPETDKYSFDSWGGKFLVVFSSIVISYMTVKFNEKATERQADVKFVELSIAILQGEKHKNPIGLRKWALQQMNKAGADISEELQRALEETPVVIGNQPFKLPEVVASGSFTQPFIPIGPYKEVRGNLSENIGVSNVGAISSMDVFFQGAPAIRELEASSRDFSTAPSWNSLPGNFQSNSIGPILYPSKTKNPAGRR